MVIESTVQSLQGFQECILDEGGGAQWVVLGVDGEQKDFNPKNRQFQLLKLLKCTSARQSDARRCHGIGL